MKHRARVTLTLLLASVAAAGCGGDDPAPEPAAALLATPTPTPTPEPQETAPQPPEVGTEQTSQLGGTVAVLDYEQPAAAAAPPPATANYPDDHVWAALDVRVCLPDHEPDWDGPWIVTRSPWALIYDDGSLVSSSHTGYSRFPDPVYPWGDQAAAPGQCIRGWITFAVPGGDWPTGVHYTGGNSVLQWSLQD